MNLILERFAIVTLAKYHAVSYALTKELGGQEKFFDKFPNFNFGAFLLDSARVMLEPMVNSGLETNMALLETNDVEGRHEALEKLKPHVGNLFSSMWDELRHNPDNERLLVLNRLTVRLTPRRSDTTPKWCQICIQK
ncbi:unnamed protein product [Orchesella dallaii]|uniref:Uncharacterized protein n=1 Tax=Orchesella dallaii TaxID=48710 RepID=A0ABP1R9K7_9HEXA